MPYDRVLQDAEHPFLAGSRGTGCERNRFAFWHRWVQDCITAFHREYVPHGELYRMARLGPIDREAVFERFKARPPAYSTKRSLHRTLRRAVKYVAHRRPRADAIITTEKEVYILKVKRLPTQSDLTQLQEYAALFVASPEWRAHAHKPVHLILLALASVGQGSPTNSTTTSPAKRKPPASNSSWPTTTLTYIPLEKTLPLTLSPSRPPLDRIGHLCYTCYRRT